MKKQQEKKEKVRKGPEKFHRVILSYTWKVWSSYNGQPNIRRVHILDNQKFTAGKQKVLDRPRPDKNLEAPLQSHKEIPSRARKIQASYFRAPIIKKGHFLNFQKFTTGKQKDHARPKPDNTSSGRPLYILTVRSCHESGKFGHLLWGLP